MMAALEVEGMELRELLRKRRPQEETRVVDVTAEDGGRYGERQAMIS